MNIRKVLYIEDYAPKYMAVYRYLEKYRFHIDRVTNAEDAVNRLENAIQHDAPYDLLISDMHFDFFGTDDRAAGENTLNLIREKGYTTPVIFCSSQNWDIPGSLGSIFFHPERDWEFEADALFRRIMAL